MLDEDAYFGGQPAAGRSNREDRHSSFERSQKTDNSTFSEFCGEEPRWRPGYSAGRKSTIDVTDLIWKRASIKSFSLFAQPPEMWRAAWNAICELLESGPINRSWYGRSLLRMQRKRCDTRSKAGPSGESYLRYDEDLEEHA